VTGSDFYYASLYEHTRAREQHRAINALKVELCAIPLTVSDTEVARVKLAWWDTEAADLINGNPHHPLTQDYYATYGNVAEVGRALAALSNGLDDELGGRQLATRDDQWAWFDNTFGPLYAVHASVSTQIIEVAPDGWQALGRWIEIGYSLLYLKPLMLRNLKRLPAADLAASSCHWADIESGNNRTAVVQLLQREVQITRDNIADILKRAPRHLRRIHRPLFTLGRIVERTLIEMQKDGYRAWRHRIELTPLRKLWIAWRMRRG